MTGNLRHCPACLVHQDQDRILSGSMDGMLMIVDTFSQKHTQNIMCRAGLGSPV